MWHSLRPADGGDIEAETVTLTVEAAEIDDRVMNVGWRRMAVGDDRALAVHVRWSR
jgi:hypothetical protein